MSTTDKSDNTTRRNKSKVIVEKRLKRYQDRVKQYKQNRTFQNNEKSSWKVHKDQLKVRKNNFGGKYGDEKNIIEMLNE